MQVVVKPANKSGNLITQFLERKELLPLDNMSREERKKFRSHSVASLKKNRKISPQRLERRERRDIQFGRKVAVKPTDIDVDEGAMEDDFGFDEVIQVPESAPRRAGRVRPTRVTRVKPTKAETPTEKATPPSRTQVREKVKAEVPSQSQGADKPEKRKSFSKVDKGEVKLKRSEIRYANSFREKKPFTNDFSKTSSFSMDLKRGVKKMREGRPVNFKNDTSYNDNNDRKPSTGRPKTKFGKVVGSKVHAKAVKVKDYYSDNEKPKSAGRKKSEFLRRSPK